MADEPTRPFDPGSIADNAIGDQPTSVDSLGFTPYVEAIARFLRSEATKPPITISIEGDWGSGKSSFLLQLEKAICGERTTTPFAARLPGWLGGVAGAPKPGRKTALSVRFNAWRHDKQDELWAAFALAFVKSLRTEVGVSQAWRGDIKLFLSRLKGARGWLELGLLVLSLAALLVGLFEVWRFATANPAEVKHMLDWLLKADAKPTPGAPASTEIAAASPVRLLASGGTFGTMAALGVAGLLKFHSYIKLPLSLKLEKYIAKPDYEGHASFIESFHLDLNRLIEAYAGDRRVFIFVDDLDRCDVPRAADLMQAINLMIGDSRNLVFIIGMDREKVAAGIAQKYKDILPFLRDSAHWKPYDEKDNYTPLYFGYGYLEKFIQISFSLPVATSDTAVASFFRDEPAPVHQSTWRSRFLAYWADWLRAQARPAADKAAAAAAAPEAAPGASPELTARIYNRLKVERDSVRIRNIVRFVSGVFEHNPRRIKQFINTFRLALYIASDQGLFDEEKGEVPAATPEQIGKFVALLLRFPDLRFALEQDPTLLGKLQEAALKAVNQRDVHYHWLDKPGTVPLLATGCGPSAYSENYSLTKFDVGRLFSVLPRAVRPPDADEHALAVFQAMAARYEALRADAPGSNARTRRMAALAAEARAQAAGLQSPASMIAQLGAGDRPGGRLMRILVAFARPDPVNLSWLMDYSQSFVSPFEHFWCLQALIALAPAMSAADRRRIDADLGARWAEILADGGREKFARELRELVGGPDASGGTVRRASADVTLSAVAASSRSASTSTARSGTSPTGLNAPGAVSKTRAPAAKKPAAKQAAARGLQGSPAAKKPAAKKPAANIA